MRDRILLAMFLALVVSAAFAGPAAAHSTPDNAPDTPVANANANGVEGFSAAVVHSQAANSLFRNPTCGAHFGPNGTHPPGNP